jgi:hypothetical protein
MLDGNRIISRGTKGLAFVGGLYGILSGVLEFLPAEIAIISFVLIYASYIELVIIIALLLEVLCLRKQLTADKKSRRRKN